MGETLQKRETAQTGHMSELKPSLLTAQMGFALVQHTDMPGEMAQEVIEVVVVACEKYADNLEQAAKMIKSEVEQKFHGHWHVVVGESFGFEVGHEIKKMLYTYFGGTLGILIWCL